MITNVNAHIITRTYTAGSLAAVIMFVCSVIASAVGIVVNISPSVLLCNPFALALKRTLLVVDVVCCCCFLLSAAFACRSFLRASMRSPSRCSCLPFSSLCPSRASTACHISFKVLLTSFRHSKLCIPSSIRVVNRLKISNTHGFVFKSAMFHLVVTYAKMKSLNGSMVRM